MAAQKLRDREPINTRAAGIVAAQAFVMRTDLGVTPLDRDELLHFPSQRLNNVEHGRTCGRVTGMHDS